MRSHTRAGVLLGTYAIVGGLISFLGWALDRPRLTDWLNDGVSIQPNTAVLLVLAGAALLGVHLGFRSVVAGLGAIVGIMGALMLLQHLTAQDFGFNHQLLFGHTWGQNSTVTPGRTGPPASMSFMLVGAALVMLSLRDDRLERRFVPVIGIVLATIMMFSVNGYLFGAQRFYSIPWLSAIALQTCTMFVALAIGLILAVPERQPMRLLLLNSGAGELARTLLPLIIIAPTFLGWLRGQGEMLGYYDTGTGRALMNVSFVVLTVGLVWPALIALRRREERDRENQEAIRQAQEETSEVLRQADRRKDEFLALLAHELRNPLAPVRHAVQVLHLSGSTDPEMGRARDVIDRQMQQMARLVDDLLDVSRISRGKVELRRERVALTKVLQGAVEASRPLIDESGQTLSVEEPADSIWLHADLTRLVQVFCNLLNNASKFSSRGARIVLSARRDGASAVVVVKDNGIGIAAETLPAVFDLFTQGEGSDGGKRGGLGIGLTLVKRLVTQHGGSVEARSEGRGLGSEFLVRLPIDSDPIAAGTPTDPAPLRATPRSSNRVLIVDDNRDAADTVGMMMTIAGVDFRTAYDGLDAVQVANGFRPDIVLLDIGLPGLTGYDVARAIRREPWGSTVVLIALTGWGQDSDRVRSMEAGFDLHLVKPVNPETLMELLTSTHGRAESSSPASE